MEGAALRETVHVTERVRVGRFRLRVGDPLFRDSGPTRAHLLVFPRTAVRITQTGARSLVADPTTVVLYNEGQEYRRDPIDPEGDRCEWFAFRSQDIVDALARHDPEAVDRVERPFVRRSARCSSSLYLRQRLIFQEILGAKPIDSLWIEEQAMGLLADVARAVHEPLGPIDEGRNALVADAVCENLARSFRRNVSLEELAKAVHVSPFHLCRVFRAHTGETIHARLHALRLHHALERLLAGERDLTALALDLGYSSHSHFTFAFRRRYGLAPSRVRSVDRRKIVTERGSL